MKTSCVRMYDTVMAGGGTVSSGITNTFVCYRAKAKIAKKTVLFDRLAFTSDSRRLRLPTLHGAIYECRKGNSSLRGWMIQWLYILSHHDDHASGKAGKREKPDRIPRRVAKTQNYCDAGNSQRAHVHIREHQGDESHSTLTVREHVQRQDTEIEGGRKQWEGGYLPSSSGKLRRRTLSDLLEGKPLSLPDVLHAKVPLNPP